MTGKEGARRERRELGRKRGSKEGKEESRKEKRELGGKRGS